MANKLKIFLINRIRLKWTSREYMVSAYTLLNYVLNLAGKPQSPADEPFSQVNIKPIMLD